MADQLVTFPDAVAVLVGYLNANITPPVHGTIPASRPAEFVHVHRLGGPRRDRVTDLPLLSVDCWADTEARADAMAQECRAWVDNLRGSIASTVVQRVGETGGPVSLPDPSSLTPRVVFSVELALRGTVT